MFIDGDGKFPAEIPFEESTEADINAFRNKLNIRVRGVNIPPPCATFQSMNINKAIKSIILGNIEKSSWKEPTPIQMQVVPAMLMGRDVLATAPTGSGSIS
jgi:superfamily II DNA/RNA helicase